MFKLLSNSPDDNIKSSVVNKQKQTADCENQNIIEEAALTTTTNPIISNAKLFNKDDDDSIPKPPPRGQKLSRKSSKGSSKIDSKPGHSGSSSPEKLRSSPFRNVNKDSSTTTPTYPLAKSPARISKSSRMRKKMETLDTKKPNKMKYSHSMDSMITKLPSDTEEGAENLVTSCMQYLYENESYSGDFPDKNDKDEEDLFNVETPKLINPFIDFQMHNEDTTIANAESRKLSTVSDIRDHIKRNTPPSVIQQQRSEDKKIMYKTLPRAFQKKKVPVPKSVRNFLEKGQILQEIRAKSSEPADDDDQKFSRQDGTESVSSFVVLSPKDNFLETTSSEGWSDNDDYEDKTDSFNSGTRKGFVNKCVSRVKNLVGNNTGPT